MKSIIGAIKHFFNFKQDPQYAIDSQNGFIGSYKDWVAFYKEGCRCDEPQTQVGDEGDCHLPYQDKSEEPNPYKTEAHFSDLGMRLVRKSTAYIPYK